MVTVDGFILLNLNFFLLIFNCRWLDWLPLHFVIFLENTFKMLGSFPMLHNDYHTYANFVTQFFDTVSTRLNFHDLNIKILFLRFPW